MSNKPHPEIERAIELCGTQVKLAKHLGVRQQTVSKLLNRQIPVTGEYAVAIDKATKGKVARRELRPDLFG